MCELGCEAGLKLFKNSVDRVKKLSSAGRTPGSDLNVAEVTTLRRSPPPMLRLLEEDCKSHKIEVAPMYIFREGHTTVLTVAFVM